MFVAYFLPVSSAVSDSVSLELDRGIRDKDEENPNGENANAFFPDTPTA